MLLLPGNSNVAQRIQGAFVSEEEVRKVVAHWRRQAPDVVYVAGVEGERRAAAVGCTATPPATTRTTTLLAPGHGPRGPQPARLDLDAPAQAQGRAERAGRIMDLLEQRGVVGPSRRVQGARHADDATKSSR